MKITLVSSVRIPTLPARLRSDGVFEPIVDRQLFDAAKALIEERSYRVTEKLLNHVSGSFAGIVGVYQRYNYAKEMREAVERWEAHLQTLIGYSREKSGDND